MYLSTTGLVFLKKFASSVRSSPGNNNGSIPLTLYLDDHPVAQDVPMILNRLVLYCAQYTAPSLPVIGFGNPIVVPFLKILLLQPMITRMKKDRKRYHIAPSRRDKFIGQALT